MRYLFLFLFTWFRLAALSQGNYQVYHQQIIEAEHQIVQGNLSDAHQTLSNVTSTYPFVFRRDLLLAAQIAASQKDSSAVIQVLQRAAQQGVRPKSIRAIPLLKAYADKIPKHNSDSPSSAFSFIDSLLRLDQKMAFRAFIKVREKARQKFYDNKFAPHSNRQLQSLISWLESGNPWPGEREVGNGYMASTIVSHHNSISARFNERDTLFQTLPLEKSWMEGYLSPFEYALMHDWRHAISNDDATRYGYVGQIVDEQHLRQVEVNRARIGLRSISLRNQLVQLENLTDFKFLLPGSPWQSGNITIKE